MNIRQFIGISFIAACLFACDDTTDTLGNSLTNKVDQFDIIPDTFEVKTKSIIIDSVLARSQYCYLGNIKDPETKTYVTSNYTTQFTILESFDNSGLFPEQDSIISRNDNNEIIADSCKLNIYFYSSIGDSLNPMKMTIYEMSKPIEEGGLYYTNYDPEEKGLLRSDANSIRKNKVYTVVDLNLGDSIRDKIVDKTNMEFVTIPLNDTYYDVEGNRYENYGTYIMRKYYSNPEYFKNSYNFIHNVCPGFYIKSTDGLGVMSEVYRTELSLYYQYKSDTSTYKGSALLSGTEEVMQTTNITNDKNTIKNLAEDGSCTYIKTPAGIFTEVTIPVDDIKANHYNDTISSAKIVFNKMNSKNDGDSFGTPQNLLMIPKDSLYKFFEEKDLPDNKTSFVATYNSSYNTYTFNNISTLISTMYENKVTGKASEDWDKVVLVPISISYNTSSSVSSITSVANEMSLKSARLVGGSQNPNAPITISVIYNRFIKE